MKKNRRILFLGNVAVAYNRAVLRGAAKFVDHRPEIRVFSPDNFEPSDLPGLLSGDIHGVIVGACPPAWQMPEKIAEMGVPAVDVSADRKACSLPRVVTDDVALGRMAADYFINRGFKRLVYYGMLHRYWSDVRWHGFSSQAEERGIAAQQFCKEQAEAEDRAGMFPGAAVKWLKKLDHPAAIFAGNDSLGAYLVEACQQLGVHIPEDIAILGVDNDDFYGQLRTPHLSSIQQNNQEIGSRAMELLYSVMHREKIKTSTVLLPPVRIITRLSSDIFGVEDGMVREALGLIQKRLREGLSVKGMAAHLAVSRPTLERHFLAVLGRTPAMEIRRIQLDTARRMLLDTDKPIAQIAMETGYSSPRQFSTSFHHHFKKTPRDMRKAGIV